MKRCILLSLLFTAPSSFAVDREELLLRIEQLEHRVDRLESHQSVDASSSDGASLSTQSEKPSSGYAHISYWLGNRSPFEPSPPPPLSTGIVKLEESITLRPQAYGVAQAGDSLFSPYLDPSRYAVAALSVKGNLLLPGVGTYRLSVKPTPPQEVGGAGSVEMSVRIFIDEQMVFEQDYSRTLQASKVEVAIESRTVPVLIEVVARSPGFGPSPTRAKLDIGLQDERGLTAESIDNFLTAKK